MYLTQHTSNIVLFITTPSITSFTREQQHRSVNHATTKKKEICWQSVYRILEKDQDKCFRGKNPVFNEGEGTRVKVFELLDLKCGQHMLEMMQALDTKRVASATSQATKTSKLQRKQRRMPKTQEKDSVYQTGGF
ncbi:hypothetical protein LSAT2_018181 [Lamellibrachia satsuma]|nr:hypothetical protein LSAT2_018181 [Lamellibrachia satsuma]